MSAVQDCQAPSQSQSLAPGNRKAAVSSCHVRIGVENLEGCAGVVFADEWSHASMISNAWMEQWPVWYDGEKGSLPNC